MKTLLASSRAEWLRLRKWPALWVMAGAWLTLNLTFVFVLPYLSYTSGESGFSTESQEPEGLLGDMLPQAVPGAIIQGLPMFGGAILLIMGALAVGSGYGWGTWKTVFTQGPSRMAAFVGTLVTLVGVVVGLIIVTGVVDLGVSVLVATAESQAIVWPDIGELARATGGGVLIGGMWTLGGVLIGTLTRSPALAVGLGLVWVLAVENLLRGVAGALEPLEQVTDVLPGTAAGSLVGALVPPGGGTPGVLTILDAPGAAWLLAGYVAVFAVVSLILVRRRDVT